MRNQGIVLALMTGIVLGSGQIARAQTTPAAKPAAANALIEVPHVMELRFLSPDGVVMGRLSLTLEKGQQLNVSQVKKMTVNQAKKTTIFRLEGRGSVEATKDGATVTLLKLESDDAIVECTISEKKP